MFRTNVDEQVVAEVAPRATLRQRCSFVYRTARMRIRTLFQRIRLPSLEEHVRNPTFIIGSARSGTTLIQGLLAEHPDIAVFPDEANYLWHPETHPWRYSRYRDEVPPYWWDPPYHTERSLKLRRGGHEDHIRTVFGLFSMRSRGEVFVNKSAKITFMVSYILHLFPEARFVNVIRDGRSVAYSQARKISTTIDTKPWLYADHGFAGSFEDVLLRCARSWQKHMLEAKRLASEGSVFCADRLLHVRYEQLCAQPVDELRRVCRFLGVDPTGIPDTLPLDVSNRNWKVRSGLQPGTYQKLDQLLEPTLKDCGYG